MRNSIAVPSIRELMNFNIAAWDVLRVVLKLASIPVVNDSSVGVSITFKNDGERNYEGKTSFYIIGEDGNGYESRSPLETQFNDTICFILPEGCNIADSFDWLSSEVAKLAYAMTGGKVFPSTNISEGAKENKDGTFTLEFYNSGEVDGITGWI